MTGRIVPPRTVKLYCEIWSACLIIACTVKLIGLIVTSRWLVGASSRNDTSHRGHWNSVDIGAM